MSALRASAPRRPDRAGAGLAALALAVALLLAPRPAEAQGTSGVGCPQGNLLAGRRPVRWQDVRGSMALPTDGSATPEGAVWNAPLALVLDTGASTITYDFGQLTTVQAVYVQADANDTYHLWGSTDGQSYRPLGTIGPVEGHGLRARRLGIGSTPLRYLRFGEGVGDGYYSISEIQAFCQTPTPFPPALKVVNAPVAQAPRTIYTYWNNETSARWELILGALGLALLFWGLWLRREGRPQHRRRLRDGLLKALGVLSLLTYFNFGFFHFGNAIHDWEWTHYYVGSKYFRELGYDRLYECIAIADAENGLRRRVELRKITNLRTNVLETTSEVLAHPERCQRHFSSARWSAFKHDVRFFRERQSARRWDDLQTDHGYNGTPVWNIAGSVLANLSPASRTQLYALAVLDPLYLLAAAGVIWWAFGWRVACVGLLVLATNFPSRYYWTGGAFLRWDWLFFTVASVCLLKKERPLAAGLAMGYATLLRVFPGFMFLGPLLAAGYTLLKDRRLDERFRTFFLGAALSVALLVPVSIQVAGGAGAYRQFVQNTIKHKETPLTNHMGLRTVMAYRPSQAGRVLRNDKYTDPWQTWKAARLRSFQEAKPVYGALVAVFIVLTALAVRGRPPWMAAALGATFIAVGVELTCYYYAFLLAVALLHAEDERVGPLLLLITGFTQVVDWRPLPNMPGWLDEQYTLMSFGTLVGFAVLLWRFGGESLLAHWRPAVAAAPAEKVEAVEPGPQGTRSPRKKKKRR